MRSPCRGAVPCYDAERWADQRRAGPHTPASSPAPTWSKAVTSLFRRATKYPASENRLTEVFAAVLERVPDLCFAILEFWDKELVSGLDRKKCRPRIDTQVLTVGGGTVDLEIKLSSVAGLPEGPGDDGTGVTPHEVLCWVEAKKGKGAKLGLLQLERYRANIESRGAQKSCVRLLVPRDFQGQGREDRDTWQELARFLARHRRQEGNLSEAHAWLVGEFLEYLKEEGLMDEERLTVQHAFVVSALPPVQSALSRVWEAVDERLAVRWGKPSKRPRTRIWSDTWTDYPIPNAQPASTWSESGVEWGMCDDDFLESEARKSLVLYAGLVSAEDLLAEPGNQAWVANLKTMGFQLISDGDQFLKHAYLEKFLEGPTLEEQAGLVADWILEAFQDVTRTPPPS
jgi:hypothetical protein